MIRQTIFIFIIAVGLLNITVTATAEQSTWNAAIRSHEMGLEELNKNDFEQAIFYFKDAIRLDPGNADYHHSLGQAYLDLGRVSEAKAEFEKAKQYDKSDYWKFRDSVAFCAYIMSDYGRAISGYKQILKMTQAVDAMRHSYEMLGRIYAFQKRYEEARNYFEKSLSVVAKERSAKRIEQYSRIIKFYSYADLASEMSIIVNQMAKHFDEAAYRLAGELYLDMKQPRKALEVYRELESKRPSDGMVHVLLGNALMGSGKRDEAKNNYDLALKLNPGNLEIVRAIAKGYVKNGLYETAKKHLSQILEDHPKDDEALALMAESKLAQREHRDALTYAANAVKNNALEPDYPALLARVYLDVKQLPQAEKVIRKNLQKYYDHAESHYLLGKIDVMSQKIEPATHQVNILKRHFADNFVNKLKSELSELTDWKKEDN